MKKRYVYAVLFGVPGLAVSALFALVVFGTSAGFFWLFVFGDDSWPASAAKVLSILFVLAFLLAFQSVLVFGFKVGKGLENEPGINKHHVMMSVVATAVPVMLLVLHQWNVGNIGARPDSLLCADYCRAEGYSASAMPPRHSNKRTCICLDNDGREAIRASMAGL